MNASVQENQVAIGARIRAIRERRKFSQYSLAKKIGKTQSYITQVESGKKGYALPTLLAIAAALDVSVEVLLGNKELDEAFPPGNAVPSTVETKEAG